MLTQIRPATPADFERIASLTKSPAELYLVYPSGQFPWDVAQLNALYTKRSDFTVAETDGQIAAFANLYQVKPGESAFIGNVIVDSAYRGLGIGRQLTQHMIRVCRDNYTAIPHLSVFGFNAPAMLMYAGLGFVPYAVEARQDLQGKPVALIHMHLRQDTQP